jgi:transposase
MSNRLRMATIQSILSLYEKRWSYRRIARALGIHRETVSRYVRLAAQAASGGPATEQSEAKPANAPIGSSAFADLAEAANAPIGSAASSTTSAAPVGRQSHSEPWREWILSRDAQGLSAQRIFQDLVSEQGAKVSYDSVRRLLRRCRGGQPLPFRRMECAPGQEAQADFGTGAWVTTPGGKRRRPHLFRLVLSFSRKGYSEVTCRQTTEDFIRCLENAFWAIGGVPKVLVIDNLRAAVKRPDWYDPELNPKLQAFCGHYGLVILPTKPRMPRHKGKVERGVGYAQGNALKGRTFDGVESQNQHLWEWETNVADTRVHGTTRKQVGKLFVEVEKPALQPLPGERFPFFHEAQRSVNRDGHIEVAKAYYSVPPEYLGRRVWVRWDQRLVHVFNQRFAQIAVHPRREPGRFSTLSAHIPNEKISGVERGARWLLDRIRVSGGPQSLRWAHAMLAARGIAGVRVLQGLRHLAERHPQEALEKACQTALSYGAYHLRTIRELLRRQATPQATFAMLEEHELIRPLAEYTAWLTKTLRYSGTDFQRHSWAKACSAGKQENGLEGTLPRGPADMLPPRSGYPLSGCVPDHASHGARPDSVSPDIETVVPHSPANKEISA